MENYGHIVHGVTREMLEQGWNGDEDSICQALSFAADCLCEDVHNELLDDRIVDSRAEALMNAESAWNDEGDGFEALECLRKFWMI